MSSLVRTSTVEFQDKLNLALALSASEAEQARRNADACGLARQPVRNGACTQEADDYGLALALGMSFDPNSKSSSNQPSVSTIEVKTRIRDFGDVVQNEP